MEAVTSIYSQIIGMLLAGVCAFYLLKFLFKIFKAIMIAICQTIIGILEFLVNSLRGLYNLFVAKENRLQPVLLEKITEGL